MADGIATRRTPAGSGVGDGRAWRATGHGVTGSVAADPALGKQVGICRMSQVAHIVHNECISVCWANVCPTLQPTGFLQDSQLLCHKSSRGSLPQPEICVLALRDHSWPPGRCPYADISIDGRTHTYTNIYISQATIIAFLRFYLLYCTLYFN